MNMPDAGAAGTVPDPAPALDPAPAPAEGPRGVSAGAARRNWADQALHRFAVVGIWVAMLLVYTGIEPSKILRAATFQSIFGSQQALVFLALAALSTLVVGEFDLSVASVMGISATVVPVLAVNHGMNAALACLIAVAAAAACGLVNAFVIVVVGVEGFVVTLGSGTLLVGLTVLISNSTTVFGLGSGLARITLTDFLGLPVSFYYGLALAVAFAYLLSFTPLGRHIAFVGANREVARLVGIRVGLIRFMSYVIGSTIAGLGGVLLVAGLGGFDPSSSAEYLLPALSAVFLGTAVVQPGRFNPLGTLIGIYFLATGILGLQLMGLGGWIEDVFYGAALVIAVAVSSLVRRRKGR
jgi:ribose transport system permease protein